MGVTTVMPSASFQLWLCVTITLLFRISQSRPISLSRPPIFPFTSTLSQRPHNYQQAKGASQLPYRTLVVDQSGHGDFTKVQSAIDSVPSNNRFWICVQLNSGIYREKVTIPVDKPYIILKGEGRRYTKIVWDDHSSIAHSATFISLADNTVVKRIAFVNSYNYPVNKNRIMPAVAALVKGDRTSFYGCGFSGVQDTLWDSEGRHYFKKCSIEGAVDFIFGGGQSIYEDCEIRVNGRGYITAQGRERPEDTGGFVFKGCSVTAGNGGPIMTYLGRPWRKYARVLFYRSNLTNVVDPKGWDSWNVNPNQVTFAEYGNYGAGADTSRRVNWVKQLPIEMWEKMTSISFISDSGWLQRQPY